MESLVIMLKNVLVFVALALPGFLLVKSRVLKREYSAGLSKLLMYVGMPFLIFTSTIKNITFNSEFLVLISISALFGITYTVAMFFMSAPLTSLEKNEKTRGMERFCAVFSNNGFLGIPLAMAVFGADSNALTVLIIINIISNILMYTLGVYLISGDKSVISIKKAFLNPVLIAFLLGMACNLLNVNSYIPEVSIFSTHFSNIVTPISMTIMGIKLAETEILTLFKSPKTYYVSFLKLVAFPIVIVTVLLICRVSLSAHLVSADLILGAYVGFAMPTAGLAPTFADNFNGDTENSVAFTLGSTLLSVLTIPLLYWMICALL